MHIDDTLVSSGKISEDFFSSAKESSTLDESSASVKELRAMKEKLSSIKRLVEDPFNKKPANTTAEWVNDKFVENPQYQKLWTEYQEKKRTISAKKSPHSDTPSLFEQQIGGIGFDVQTFKGGMHLSNLIVSSK